MKLSDFSVTDVSSRYGWVTCSVGLFLCFFVIYYVLFSYLEKCR